MDNYVGNHQQDKVFVKKENVQIKLQILVNKIVNYIFNLILLKHNVHIQELDKCAHHYKMIVRNILVLLNNHVEQ